ncbi:hypothetical protein WA026_005219, partial [Henosepilachna vigintioctopunctata]
YYPIEMLGDIKEKWHSHLPRLLFYDKTAPFEHQDLIHAQIREEYFIDSFDLNEQKFDNLIDVSESSNYFLFIRIQYRSTRSDKLLPYAKSIIITFDVKYSSHCTSTFI